MDCLIGIKGKDFVLLATDQQIVRSIVVMKSGEPKFRHLNKRCVLAFCGEPGDTIQFAEYVQRNIAYYDLRHYSNPGDDQVDEGGNQDDGTGTTGAFISSSSPGPRLMMSVNAAAAFTRKELAESLRSRKPWQVNLLVGGVDPVAPLGQSLISSDSQSNGNMPAVEFHPKLYWIDYLGSMVDMPFAIHGYGSYFCLGLLDKQWRSGMDKAEVLELLKQCMRELRTRFIVNLPTFAVRIISCQGVEQINDLVID